MVSWPGIVQSRRPQSTSLVFVFSSQARASLRMMRFKAHLLLKPRLSSFQMTFNFPAISSFKLGEVTVVCESSADHLIVLIGRDRICG